jgi:dihydropteroate synthase
MLLLRHFLLRHFVPRNDNPRNDKMLNAKCQMLNCAGKTIDLSTPVVMGILNLTPDSFFDGSFYPGMKERLQHVERMIGEGAAIIDIGAVSTRPGAEAVSEQEELDRLVPLLDEVIRHFPCIAVSVDTFRSSVAKVCIDKGAGMINDIYGGRFDAGMIPLFSTNDVAYVLMHMQGTPDTMQVNPIYLDVVEEVSSFFKAQLAKFRPGFTQIILDPGFGFGKSVDHNFSLLSHLDHFTAMGFPVLAGLSRKSMINKVLKIQPGEALNGTTVLNTIALLKGASILRVHDVREAIETVKLVGRM